MKIRMPSIRRVKYILTSLSLLGAALVPALSSAQVFAYGQVTSRSIQMNSSTPGAGTQTYKISFTTVSSTIVKAVVIDFCDESPILASATCSLPTGMVVGSGSIATTGLSSAGTWSAAVGNSRYVTVSNASATATGETAARTITLSGFTNPSVANHTFYGRIYTYSSTTTGYGTSGATIGTPLDAGGVAMSTANDVSVTGTVQETLTFCTASVTLVDTDCATTATGNPPNLTLGTGTPKVIDDQNVYSGSVYSKISTNAGSGVVIRMKSSNSCGGLQRQGQVTCEIPAVGAVTGSATSTLSAGPLFGMKAASVNDTTGSSGTLSAQAPYNTSDYGMDAVSAQNVTTTYGDDVASSSGVLSKINTTYTFAVRAGSTTPAGVYAVNMSLIATSTY